MWGGGGGGVFQVHQMRTNSSHVPTCDQYEVFQTGFSTCYVKYATQKPVLVCYMNDTKCSWGSGDGYGYLSTPGCPIYLGDLCACRKDIKDGLFYFIFRVLSCISFLLLILFSLTLSYRFGRQLNMTTILLTGP